MSIVNKKPQLDLVLAFPEAIRQEIEQKERYNDALQICSCFKEFGTAKLETLNPKMKFSIQPSVYSVSSNASTLSGNVCKVKESGSAFLKASETGCTNFNQLTESYLIVTGRALEFLSCPEAPENRN